METTKTLDSNYKIPVLGLGTYLTPAGKAKASVINAINAGYRHIDKARIYENEKEVAEGVKESGVNRSEIFITTKIWPTEYGFDKARAAVKDSLKKMNLEYLDLVLMHWPSRNRDEATWKGLESLKREGLIRNIGVSNFNQHHLEKLLSFAEIKPVLNQFELHPFFQQKSLVKFCLVEGINVEGWAPLARGKVLDNEVLKKIAQKHGKNAAQVAVRWSIEQGYITIPKSTHKKRILENFDVFDFSLDEEDKEKILGLDTNVRMFRNPDDYEFDEE